MRKDNRMARIEKWVKSLKAKESKELLPDLVDFMIDAEMISFYEDNEYPYWSNTGEPLIDGQENSYDD